MNVSREQYDAIVIGVGGMGSATVYRLAERGLDVLGIERFDIPHARGSSHGSTRIVRLTQPEDPSYVPLARATFENWRELAASTVALGVTAIVPLVPVALFAWFFLLGVAMWAALPAMNAITSQYSERAFSGSLFGVMLTAGSLGGTIGPLLFGVTAERFGLGAAFPLVGIISAGGAVAFLGMYRI